jgi:hypothetical protein
MARQRGKVPKAGVIYGLRTVNALSWGNESEEAELNQRRITAMNAITNLVGRALGALNHFRGFIWLLVLVGLSVSQTASAKSVMLVSDRQTRNIFRYDLATGQFVDTFITQGTGGLEGGVDLNFGPDGMLYVSSTPVDAPGTSQILKFNPNTGAFLGVFVQLAGQGEMVFGPDGNLYVTDRLSAEKRVLKYNGKTGESMGYFTQDVGLYEPISLTFGPDGNIYVGESFGFYSGVGTVKKFSGTTGAFLGTFNNQIGGMPEELVFDPDGNLRVTVYTTNTILTLDGKTGQILSSFSDGLAGPGDLEFNTTGDLYVTNCFGNRITKYAGGVGSAMTVFASGSPLTGCPMDILIANYSDPTPGDVDGDGKADFSVFRPNDGVWYILNSGSPGTYASTKWGITNDIPVSADYDDDGKMDIAVWRPSTGVWYIQNSGSPGTYASTKWGITNDIPVPADYDGDGKTDVAVWRPSSGTFYVLSSKSPGAYTATQWGTASDIPVLRQK